LRLKINLQQFNSNCREMELIFRAVYAKARGNRPAVLAQTWSAYDDLWVELIRSGVKGGELDARLDPKLVAYAML
jgi:hypothetical protein